jgi:hypothetical protein
MGTATAALASSLPVAIDDHVAGSGGTLHIYVLANDSGDFDPSTLALASQPSQGQATVIATGSPRIKYSSASGGNDSFSYRICNSAGMCATATVTVGATATTTEHYELDHHHNHHDDHHHNGRGFSDRASPHPDHSSPYPHRSRHDQPPRDHDHLGSSDHCHH